PAMIAPKKNQMAQPYARSIFHPWRRNKTDRPWPARSRRSTRTRSTRVLLSCDEAEPLHFSIEPNAVNDQANRRGERTDGSDDENRRAFAGVDPNARGPG